MDNIRFRYNHKCIRMGCPNLTIYYGSKYCKGCIDNGLCRWGRCIHSAEEGTNYCSKHVGKRPCRYWGCCDIVEDGKNYCDICILLHICHKDGCVNMLPKSWNEYCDECTTADQMA